MSRHFNPAQSGGIVRAEQARYCASRRSGAHQEPCFDGSVERSERNDGMRSCVGSEWYVRSAVKTRGSPRLTGFRTKFADDIKGQLIDLGILEVLIPLTASDSVEVQGNSAAAIGNLSAKADDYSKFNEVWLQPGGGLHGYLVRFLESEDRTFQHIAVWTIVQFLEGGDKELASSLKSSGQVLPLVEKLVQADPSLLEGDGAQGEQQPSKQSKLAQKDAGEVNFNDSNEVRPSDSISQYGGSEDEYGEGEAEIPQLAKRILEMI